MKNVVTVLLLIVCGCSTTTAIHKQTAYVQAGEVVIDSMQEAWSAQKCTAHWVFESQEDYEAKVNGCKQQRSPATGSRK